MQQITLQSPQQRFTISEKGVYKCRRDELFYTLLNGWNEDRVKAGYKPLSKARLASAIAINPFLKSDDELELLIKNCQSKKSYKYAHWVLFPKK